MNQSFLMQISAFSTLPFVSSSSAFDQVYTNTHTEKKFQEVN